MRITAGQQRRLRAVLPLAIGLCAASMVVWHGTSPIDDAFISFRYAWNLAHGQGLVFNAGQRVMGSTTPGFCLLLAAFARVGASVEASAFALGIAGAAASAALVTWLLVEESLVIAAAAGLAVALNALFVTESSTGMEASVYSALLLAAIALLRSRAPAPLGGAALGLAALVRPEGVAAAGVIGLVLLARTPPRRWFPCAVAACVPLLLWGAYAYSSFGSVVPHSVTAKLGVDVDGGAATLRDLGLAGLFLPHRGLTAAWLWPLPALVVGVAVVRRLGRPDAKVLSAAAACLATHLAGYGVAVTRGVQPQPWYLAQLIPFWALCLGGAVVVLVEPARLRAALGVALALPSWLGCCVIAGRLGAPGGRPMMATRAAAYLEVAHQLAPFVGPGDVVAVPEVGAVAWGLRSTRMLDTMGLVSPETLEAWRGSPPENRKDGQIDPRLIDAQRPRWIISPPGFLARLRDARFERRYALFARLDGRSVLVAVEIWRRRDPRQ